MNRTQIAKKLLPPIIVDLGRAIKRIGRTPPAQQYLQHGCAPWTAGYQSYRRQVITQALGDDPLLAKFRQDETLPAGYGIGVDERCVEYPWLLAKLGDKPELVLDAGSILNFDFILEHPYLHAKKLHIMTLAPERHCFWQKNISYIFHDLRDNPIREAFYDTIVCISTLEHIGFDNTNFTNKQTYAEDKPDDFVLVMQEFYRILKPGGQLLLTVPFGIYRHFGWFQQFDEVQLARLLQAFGQAKTIDQVYYRYSAQGWNRAAAADCANCEYVEWLARAWSEQKWPNPIPLEPDKAAAARAVACIRLVKP